ncbi:unnamed protein product [Moneuplotes crassus]|uniref:Hexose transporter 1 n=1 Tax=Euplotes crassus TaxID=5936 RepID=A0AAD1UB78_EUPCR|nr:unnamed protein product [Moneuplotes crassus]
MNKVNHIYLILWMIVISLGMFQFGYGNASFSNLQQVLFFQYQDAKGEVISTQKNFNSVVTTAVPAGAAIGSFTGGFFTPLGRRPAIMITNVIIVAGVGVTMIFNFYALIIGRILFGYGIGVMTVLTPLFISETSPVEVAGPMGSLSQIMVTVGIMIAYMFGFLAPIRYLDKEGDPEMNPDVLTTQSWRIIFAVPAAISIFQTLMLLVVFRYDTPKFYQQKGDRDMIKAVNAVIYKEKSGEDQSENLVQNEDDNAERVTLGEMFGSVYRYVLIIGSLLAMFQQMTGINMVIFYSNVIFTQGLDEGYTAETKARIGTIIVGVVNLAATVVAIPLLAKFGRKILMLSGHFMMTVSLAVLGVFAITGFSTGTIIFTLVFIAFFEIGVGSILFLYLAEIMPEAGLSIPSGICWVFTIIIGLITPNLFDWLKATGVYFVFTGINFVGILFILFLIKETKGKSKIELESLYTQKRRNYQSLPEEQLNSSERPMSTDL